MPSNNGYIPIAEAIKEAASKVSIPLPRGWNNEEMDAMFRREGSEVLQRNELTHKFGLLLKELGDLNFPFSIELCGILDQSRYNIGKLHAGRYEQNGKCLRLYEASVRTFKKLLDVAEEIIYKEKKVMPLHKELGEPPTLYGIETVR